MRPIYSIWSKLQYQKLKERAEYVRSKVRNKCAHQAGLDHVMFRSQIEAVTALVDAMGTHLDTSPLQRDEWLKIQQMAGEVINREYNYTFTLSM